MYYFQTTYCIRVLYPKLESKINPNPPKIEEEKVTRPRSVYRYLVTFGTAEKVLEYLLDSRSVTAESDKDKDSDKERPTKEKNETTPGKSKEKEANDSTGNLYTLHCI